LREDCDQIFHLGDAIAIGAYSAEVLDHLLLHDVRLIMGNHEVYFLSKLPEKHPDMSIGEYEHQKWVASSLGRLHRSVIKRSSFRHDEVFKGISLSFMHYALKPDYTAGNNFKDFSKALASENIDDIFSRETADIVFFGHIHRVLDICGESGRRYVCPGSLGCQKDDFADYCIVNIRSGSYTIDHRRVKYDKARAIADLDDRKVPEREFIKKAFYGVA
jgi:predicted phosphodiesterase